MPRPGDNITREQIAGYIEEARVQKKNKQTHVQAKLEADFPGLVGQTVRRNGREYDAIQLLLSDVGSY